jgi:subtilisin family serine protease
MEAFKGATAAGVLVAAAAGNAGPMQGSVDNAAPWLLTVAAGTHARLLLADAVVTTNGANLTFTGASSNIVGAGPVRLWYAGDSNAQASLCSPGTLKQVPGIVAAGAIVVCKRGETTRTAKSEEVEAAGGIGMILVNVPGSLDTQDADAHAVPTVHLSTADGAALLALMAADGAAAARITPRYMTQTSEAPQVADFSSRGPAPADNSNVLKPDLLAPGSNIFAAALDRGASGNDTGVLLSGTSMASPHVAGVAALVRAAHPDWSPAAVKSAIMTTASLVTNKGNPITGTPFDYGAGHVDARRALDPGLVYDAGEVDYQRWQVRACGLFRLLVFLKRGRRQW